MQEKKKPSLPTYKELWDRRVAWMTEFNEKPTRDEILSWKYKDKYTHFGDHEKRNLETNLGRDGHTEQHGYNEQERRDALTPYTAEYLLKDKSNCDRVYDEVIESLDLLDVERLGESGLSVVSAMEPADGEKYLNDRLDTLGNINKYVTDMMEHLELELINLLNSYNEGE